MSGHDPLWRAVVRGDTACPDGADLASLGSLVRRGSAPPAPVDLRERVQAAATRCDEADQVQALYEGEQA
ncbi:MAG: hypothetical protein ACOCXA_05280, partial [Planctomycetota bacterium]